MKTKMTGLFIKKSRINIGMTQKQLAKILGYDDARVIHQIEKGAMRPPLRKARRLCRALFVEPSQLALAMMNDFKAHLEDNIK